ncbi:MAG: hypothetical protein BWK79_15995 [Beggiatoa sp. IS2]|nr:MAG: hypothetical protein BWK79_15995 [Beggiatoa sp. IS2]
MTKQLTAVKILVTRPTRQADHLCQLIEAEGGQPVRLPTIEIVDMEDNSALHACCTQLNLFDLAIFISTNAVEKALPTLLAHGNLPAHLSIAAVGQRTAETLQRWGISALYAPAPFNSETLLTLPLLQAVQGKRIVIFRGEGGRELLAETLRQRGATVDYINVYRRIQPPIPNWLADSKIDLIIVTSGESLRNLWALLAGHVWLSQIPLVLMSARLVAEARALGTCAPLFVAPEASDAGLLAAVLQWRQTLL